MSPQTTLKTVFFYNGKNLSRPYKIREICCVSEVAFMFCVGDCYSGSLWALLILCLTTRQCYVSRNHCTVMCRPLSCSQRHVYEIVAIVEPRDVTSPFHLSTVSQRECVSICM